MIQDISIEQKITEATTVILSRPSSDEFQPPVIFRNGNSALISEFSKINFEEWLENPTLTFIKNSNNQEAENIEDIFVSPVKRSIKVKLKVKIGGKVTPIPVDSENIVFLDE
jgi:hypothetical protein